MKHSRIARAIPAFMLAMLVSLWVAPAAHAQLGLEGAADSTVGTITDGLEGESSGSSTEDEGEESGDGSLIGGIVEEVEKTVETGKEDVQQITEDTGDALGNVGSETVTGTVETVEETLGGKVSGKTKKHGTAGSREDTRTTSPTTDRVVVLGNSLADALQADNKIAATIRTDGAAFASASEIAPEESLISQIGRIATEAMRQAAFPLALTLMVAGFLMVQNRLDRRDPKLALAPVDSEQDLLSFT